MVEQIKIRISMLNIFPYYPSKFLTFLIGKKNSELLTVCINSLSLPKKMFYDTTEINDTLD